MPSFNDPVADADELREAVRGLAHATRSIDDPTASIRSSAPSGPRSHR